MKRIYLDHAATTPIDKQVLRAMHAAFQNLFGNPSSLHDDGRKAAEAIQEARSGIAEVLGARAHEIIFTGSGTESDNLAILGIARAYQTKGKHIIVSKIEHKAVLEAAHQLEKEGFKITYLDVDEQGLVNPHTVIAAITPETTLISIMYANNEIGTVEPIAEIGALLKTHRAGSPFPFFHTDACQAAGALPLRVKELGVDLLTINGSKIYGPKGVGCLFVRDGVQLEPIVFGGGQERGLRGGTENTPLIVGFAKALSLAEKNREKTGAKLSPLRDYFMETILKTIPDTKVSGARKNRLANNVHISFYGIEGESIVLLLDHAGISASTTSACSARDLTVSHVLRAIGAPHEWAHSAVRFTLGSSTTKKDIDRVLKILPEIIAKLRAMSPVTNNNLQ